MCGGGIHSKQHYGAAESAIDPVRDASAQRPRAQWVIELMGQEAADSIDVDTFTASIHYATLAIYNRNHMSIAGLDRGKYFAALEKAADEGSRVHPRTLYQCTTMWRPLSEAEQTTVLRLVEQNSNAFVCTKSSQWSHADTAAILDACVDPERFVVHCEGLLVWDVLRVATAPTASDSFLAAVMATVVDKDLINPKDIVNVLDTFDSDDHSDRVAVRRLFDDNAMKGLMMKGARQGITELVGFAGYKGLEWAVLATSPEERGTAVLDWVRKDTYDSYRQLLADVQTVTRLVQSGALPPSKDVFITVRWVKHHRCGLARSNAMVPVRGAEDELKALVLAEVELSRITSTMDDWVGLFRELVWDSASYDHTLSQKRKAEEDAAAEEGPKRPAYGLGKGMMFNGF